MQIEENKIYTTEELKEYYNQNKIILKFLNNYDEEIEINIARLQQGKVLTLSGYPYGRLKCLIRFWIETTTKGSRFCTQTQNPKTLKWNNPKKSTYDALKFLVINPEGHIKTISLDYNDSKNKIDLFLKEFKEDMNKQQLIEFSKVMGYNEVMQHVEFKIKTRLYKHRVTGEIMDTVSMFDLKNVDECDEQGNLINVEEEKRKEKEINKKINQSIASQSRYNYLKLNYL